jgi:hypothetical protein
VVPSVAQATVRGPCTAELAGQSITRGHDTAGSAVRVDYRSAATYSGATTDGQAVTLFEAKVEFPGLDFRVVQEPIGGSTWSSSIPVDDYAWAGIGLYRVKGTAFADGARVCSGVVYVCVEGKFPLATVAGGAAAGLAVVALLLLIRGVSRRGELSRGGLSGRLGIAGLLGGAGAAVLLQQSCVAPLTLPLAAAALLGGPAVMVVIAQLLGGGRVIPAGPAGGEEPFPVQPALAPAPPPAQPQQEEPRQDQPLIYRFVPEAGACRACQSHAANRVYSSAEAMMTDRAHPGCRCGITQQPVDSAAHAAYFTGGRPVYDPRGA